MKNYSLQGQGFILFFLMVLNFKTQAQTWTQKTNIPLTREDAFCFSLGDKIYVGGGRGSSTASYTDFWEYDPAGNTWTQKIDLPGNIKRINSISFAYNGQGYIGLGQNGTAVSNELYQYDPSADTWTQMSNLPAGGRCGSGCFVINDKAYVIGGYNFSTSFFQVWSYDIINDTWTQKQNFPTNITDAMSFSIGNKGYMCCGDETSGIGMSTKTYAYDPVTDHWTLKAPFPGTARQMGVAFTIGDKAYCGLGTSEFLSPSYKDFYIYDPAGDSWELLGNFPGGSRYASFAGQANSKGYVGGGSGASGFFEFKTPLATTIDKNRVEEEFSVYPVPSAEKISFKNPVPGKFKTYRLINMKGETIREERIPVDGILKTDVSDGVYDLLIFSEKETISRRIIVQHE